MEVKNRKCVSSELKIFDHLAKNGSFVEITEWQNGEGWDISIDDKTISLTIGQLEAINYLTKVLEYN